MLLSALVSLCQWDLTFPDLMAKLHPLLPAPPPTIDNAFIGHQGHVMCHWNGRVWGFSHESEKSAPSNKQKLDQRGAQSLCLCFTRADNNYALVNEDGICMYKTKLNIYYEVSRMKKSL